MSEHTRNQKRMYRIHKQEEKILEQKLMISSLQQKVEQLEKENKILKDTILKALEFINNHTYRWKDTQFGEMVEAEEFEQGLKPIELINILLNKYER